MTAGVSNGILMMQNAWQVSGKSFLNEKLILLLRFFLAKNSGQENFSSKNRQVRKTTEQFFLVVFAKLCVS